MLVAHALLPPLVWPRASAVTSPPFWRCRATSSACPYGVAGSPVLPITTIGGEPGAVTVWGCWVTGSGQKAQGSTSLAMAAPNLGDRAASWSENCFQLTAPIGWGESTHSTPT